jgi:hypothetical protein
MNATQSASANVLDLGYKSAVLDKYPTPEVNRDLLHLRLTSIPRDFKVRKQGRFLIVNCDCGTHTYDEARYDPEFGKGAGNHNLWESEEYLAPPPEGWWTWKDFALDIIEELGVSRRSFVRAHDLTEDAFNRLCRGCTKMPGEQMRIKLIRAARELGLIGEE